MYQDLLLPFEELRARNLSLFDWEDHDVSVHFVAIQFGVPNSIYTPIRSDTHFQFPIRMKGAQ